MPTARITRPALNFDAPEPVVTADPNASALFLSQPIYARTPTKKASGNLPLLIGVPVVLVAAGALLWGVTANRGEAPTDQKSMQTAVADTPAPKTAPVPASVTATPAPIPQPTELAVNETPAPAPVARTATPRAAAPVRPIARRAAPTTPDASSASANVSATVPAAPPTVSAPAIAEPAPLVIPAPAAPAPATEPSAPM